jgi:hypothetical protein
MLARLYFNELLLFMFLQWNINRSGWRKERIVEAAWIKVHYAHTYIFMLSYIFTYVNLYILYMYVCIHI